MATVFVGRRRSAVGIWRLVAIKKAHSHLLEDPSFCRMLLEEARLASQLHHSNVVSVLEVEQLEDQLLLIMDYIEGASLSDLLVARPDKPLAPRVGLRIALDACAGLHAAHILCDASGQPLRIVHRDVSPHNLLVGIDGVARLTDFGIAKSAQQGTTTTTGALKGKLAYMAPEYVDGKPPDARCDVFALGVVIWEALSNRRLFRGDNEAETLKRVLHEPAPPLSSVAPWLGADLDAVLATALAKDPNQRFSSAKALGNALEIAAGKSNLIGSAEEVGGHVRALFEGPLAERRRIIQERIGATSGAFAAATATPPPLTAQAATPARASPAVRQLAATINEPHALAATTNDPHVLAATAHMFPTGSTLDGSGVSRSNVALPALARPGPSRRTLLFALFGGALVAGALIAIIVGQLTGARPASSPAASTGSAQAPMSATSGNVAPASAPPGATSAKPPSATPTVPPRQPAPRQNTFF